jgi:hypothetical protein
MKKIVLFILSMLFVSCGTVNTITLTDGDDYCNEDAIIAYDLYYELYKNKVIDEKPIIIKKEYPN